VSTINLSAERGLSRWIKAMDYDLGHMDGDMPAEPDRSRAVLGR
jgi:hypothetical protein